MAAGKHSDLTHVNVLPHHTFRVSAEDTEVMGTIVANRIYEHCIMTKMGRFRKCDRHVTIHACTCSEKKYIE